MVILVLAILFRTFYMLTKLLAAASSTWFYFKEKRGNAILLLPVQGKGHMRSSTRILICTRILNSKSSVSSMYKIKIKSQYPVDILDVLFHH